ncbi:MAG: hypothetical protein AAFN91_15935 [Pseudomonadota bacterium]
MTLETIYYITQIIAVGAILASLGAIYIQLRKDHALARSERQQEILNVTNSVYEYLACQSGVVKSVRLCFQDYERASPEAQVEFGYLIHRGLNLAQQAAYMRDDKLIEDNLYSSAFGLVLMYLNTPGGREYWKRVRLSYTENMRTAIDTALKTPKDIAPIWDVYPFFLPEEATSIASESDEGST